MNIPYFGYRVPTTADEMIAVTRQLGEVHNVVRWSGSQAHIDEAKARGAELEHVIKTAAFTLDEHGREVWNKLLPCPHCENTDIRLDEHLDYKSPTGKVFSMCCYKCGATFPNRYMKHLLINAWNRRPQLKEGKK